MIKGKMLLSIIDKGESSKVMDALRSIGATGGTVINAHGTATSSILSLLGLGDTKKEILLSMIKEELEEKCLDAVKTVKAKGVVAILGEKGDENMNKEDLVMLQIICESGYADDIMDAARKEGAKGGTVIKGHGTAKEDDTKFFGYSITAEKEILLIVEEKNKAEKIVEKINSLPFLSQKGKAVVFSIPVSSFSSIG